VGHLAAVGLEHVRSRRVQLRSKRYDLTCSPVGQQVVATFTPVDEPRERLKLTPRELDVLRQLARGQTVPAIARELDITTSTVRTHVEHMRNKLGVATQAALVARGFQSGYLT